MAMGPKTITLTGTGSGASNSSPVRLNRRGGNVALSFTTSGSTTAFTVQYTLTSPEGYASSTAWGAAAVWSNHSTLAAETAAADGVIDFPVQGVRLSASASGTDVGTLTILQGK